MLTNSLFRNATIPSKPLFFMPPIVSNGCDFEILLINTAPVSSFLASFASLQGRFVHTDALNPNSELFAVFIASSSVLTIIIGATGQNFIADSIHFMRCVCQNSRLKEISFIFILSACSNHSAFCNSIIYKTFHAFHSFSFASGNLFF